MYGLDASGLEVERTAGVGTGYHVDLGPGDRRFFPGSNVTGQTGFKYRIGTAGTATEAFIVKLDDLADESSEHNPGGAMNPLNVTQMARVLDTNTQRKRVGNGGKTVHVGRQPFLDVVHPLGELGRLGSTDKVTVVLHGRSTAGGVDEDRAACIKPGDHGPGQRAGPVSQSGVTVQGPTTRCCISGGGDPKAGRFQHGLGGTMNIALPGVHDAPGEQIHIVTAGAMFGPPNREPSRKAKALGNEMEPLGHGQRR